MPPTHPTYRDDFRQEAVNLLLSSGRPLKRVAEDLGITANSLRTWRNRALGNGGVAQAASTETGAFQLEGQEFMAYNGGPHFKFTRAISLLRELQNAAGSR